MTSLTSIAFIACFLSTSAHRPAPDLASRRDELADAHRRAAARAQTDFVGALVGTMAPQGLYGAAVRTLGKGPEAARAFLLRDTLNARSHAIWTVVRLDVSADGNDGYSYGYLDVVRPAGDTLFGSYKSYWRRGADGNWQVLAIGRGQRQRGPIAPLPDSLRPTAVAYKSWPARDTVAAWGTLRSTETAFSDSAAVDIRAAFISFAAPDAAKIQGTNYVFGSAAMGNEFLNPPPDFGGISWWAEYGSVAGSNDLGFNMGPVARRNAPPGAPPAGGLFFTVWRRQPNGEWKYLVD